MTSLDDIRRVVREIPDEVVRNTCIRLADELWRYVDDGSTMWTFKGLSKLIGMTASDPVLHRCVLLLASRPSAKLLDIHFLYFDPEDEDSPGEKVEDDTVSSAYKLGYLVDPKDGREVYDFEQTLVPYFLISEEVKGHGTDR